MSNESHDEGESEGPGKVYLVGAGPGDPDLITLRGVECLRRADVILYDYLANPRLLEHAHSDAELVCLGRHGQSRIWRQDEINDYLIELARSGRAVVRLKSGDPAVFARGAEEAEILARHNIPFEIVPGITAALAAGSCAGIPVTHRDFASAVALVTGRESPGKQGSAIDYRALASFPGTIVFYMGVTTADRWTSDLIEAGKSPDTPTAIVRRCSFPDQQTIRCTLGEVASYLTSSKIRPPAIVIIGEVTSLSDSLDWFQKRPLFGQKILISRPREQCDVLRDQLAELGADVLVQPAIQVLPLPDHSQVDAMLERLSTFDWLAFTSPNGVRFLFDRLFECGRDLRALAGVKLAVIGPGTARALRDHHLNADLQPDLYRAEALAEALAPHAAKKRVLYARASRGRDVLIDMLQEADAEVEQVVAYLNTDVDSPSDDNVEAMNNGSVDWVTVTSSAIARSLVAMFGESLRQTRLASISPITSGALRERGFEPTVEAKDYTVEGVVDAILAIEQS